MDTGNIGHKTRETLVTRHRTKLNKKKNIKKSNMDPTKKLDIIHVLVKGKQFLLLTRHPSCYSYSPVW